MPIFRRFLSPNPGLAFRRTFSTKESSKKSSSFITKLGILIGAGSLPIFGFFLYDRYAPLPEELQNLNFPFPARFHIRRALYPANSCQETARHLDLAMQKVLNAGIGSASPESTALVLYLSRLYLDAKEPSISDLEAAHYALTFKPHVGEAVKEEEARIELSFKVAERLCSFFASNGHENWEKVQFYAGKSVDLMENGPSYLKRRFEDHQLKSKFKDFLSTKTQ